MDLTALSQVPLLEALPPLPALKLLDFDFRGPQDRSQQAGQETAQESGTDEDVDLVGFVRRAIDTAHVLTRAEVRVRYSQPCLKGRFLRVTKRGDDITVFSKGFDGRRDRVSVGKWVNIKDKYSIMVCRVRYMV